MNPDQEIERREKASLAVGARQYVKKSVETFIENGLSGLESTLGSKEFSVERVCVTLGGIMAMRQFLRKIDADIRRGTESAPSPQGTA